MNMEKRGHFCSSSSSSLSSFSSWFSSFSPSSSPLDSWFPLSFCSELWWFTLSRFCILSLFYFFHCHFLHLCVFFFFLPQFFSIFRQYVHFLLKLTIFSNSFLQRKSELGWKLGCLKRVGLIWVGIWIV